LSRRFPDRIGTHGPRPLYGPPEPWSFPEPDPGIERKRRYRKRHRDELVQKHAEYNARTFARRQAYWTANRMRLAMNKVGHPVAVGEVLWVRQGGLCGLSGRPLDRKAMHLDHVVPTSRGGSHDPDNPRWVTAEANLAKGKLLDSEFVALACDILRALKVVE